MKTKNKNNQSVTELPNGQLRIQMDSRKNQLNDISNFIDQLLPNNGTEQVVLSPKVARQLWGYGQQIGIISDEM